MTSCRTALFSVLIMCSAMNTALADDAAPDASMAAALERTPMGASVLDRRDEAGGSDVRFLDAGGVPSLAPIVDTRTYFDYHHSARTRWTK